jgi:hypothetical protein
MHSPKRSAVVESGPEQEKNRILRSGMKISGGYIWEAETFKSPCILGKGRSGPLLLAGDH